MLGLLHPGEMGAAVGARLREAGHDVGWASAGRSAETARRAQAAGLEDAGTVSALAASSAVVLSICPPHAARDVAREAAACRGLYVDCNAIAPATVRALEELLPHARLVDGGIVGPPPATRAQTRLYVSGPAAEEVRDRLDGALDVRVVPGDVGAASALKMAYAAWTKGTSALLLAARGLARAEGVEAALLDEWALSQPDLQARSERAAAAATAKGWRWEEEMRQIDAALAAAGVPAGFGGAAAEVYARTPREGDLDAVLEALRARPG